MSGLNDFAQPNKKPSSKAVKLTVGKKFLSENPVIDNTYLEDNDWVFQETVDGGHGFVCLRFPVTADMPALAVKLIDHHGKPVQADKETVEAVNSGIQRQQISVIDGTTLKNLLESTVNVDTLRIVSNKYDPIVTVTAEQKEG